MNHPRSRLDTLIHQPIRLSIVAALAASDELEFSFVRESVAISASLLSRQVLPLEEAGYVNVGKGHVGKRPRTWLSLTPAGREAVDRHLDALRDIVNGPKDDPAETPSPPGDSISVRSNRPHLS